MTDREQKPEHRFIQFDEDRRKNHEFQTDMVIAMILTAIAFILAAWWQS